MISKRESNKVPLTEKIRPKTFKEFIGQVHLMGKEGPIRKMIEVGKIFPMIFWGPPGSGKTTLAELIAKEGGFYFIKCSAVETSLLEIKNYFKKAIEIFQLFKKQTIIFIDEFHRFNKAQQDFFLPYLEKREPILIGATTLNPSFEFRPALLSRVKVFKFQPLQPKEIKLIIKRASDYLNISLTKEALKFLLNFSDGDARKVINLLELASCYEKRITKDLILKISQEKAIFYDKDGDYHFDTISAFIKSLRNSKSKQALYFLARMIKAGEDPKFIARRLVIFASEDIGNADPNALVIAISAAKAVELVGLPEAAINLAQATLYLAKAPKSRAIYNTFSKVSKLVEERFLKPIPEFLKNRLNLWKQKEK